MFLPRMGVSKSKKRFVALARVSSREQEREGFSLDVQVDALRLYAERNNGEIIRFFRIAETASKHDERTTFRMAFPSHKRDAGSFVDAMHRCDDVRPLIRRWWKDSAPEFTTAA